MEIWDLYDKEGRPLGKTHPRGKEIEDGCYHLVVHVWITDGKGRYLISQRAETRPSYPLFWECQGGSVLAGESSLDGALREVFEEVGVALNRESGRVVYKVTRDWAHDIMDVWLFTFSGDVDIKKATTDEVCQIRWMTSEEIFELQQSGKFVPTLTYFSEKVCGKQEKAPITD